MYRSAPLGHRRPRASAQLQLNTPRQCILSRRSCKRLRFVPMLPKIQITCQCYLQATLECRFNWQQIVAPPRYFYPFSELSLHVLAREQIFLHLREQHILHHRVEHKHTNRVALWESILVMSSQILKQKRLRETFSGTAILRDLGPSCSLTPAISLQSAQLNLVRKLRCSRATRTEFCRHSSAAASSWVTVGQVGKLQKDFTQRGVKLAALSCNDTESHKA